MVIDGPAFRALAELVFDLLDAGGRFLLVAGGYVDGCAELDECLGRLESES